MLQRLFNQIETPISSSQSKLQQSIPPQDTMQAELKAANSVPGSHLWVEHFPAHKPLLSPAEVTNLIQWTSIRAEILFKQRNAKSRCMASNLVKFGKHVLLTQIKTCFQTLQALHEHARLHAYSPGSAQSLQPKCVVMPSVLGLSTQAQNSGRYKQYEISFTKPKDDLCYYYFHGLSFAIITQAPQEGSDIFSMIDQVYFQKYVSLYLYNYFFSA